MGMTNYKSKIVINQAAIYTPYIPNMSWKHLLRSMHVSYSDWTNDTPKEIALEKANERMQNFFPGNYKVVEKFNLKIGKPDFALEFDTPEDETLFLLKYS